MQLYPDVTQIAGGVTVSPIILQNNLPLVNARINDHGPFLLLVDTGASGLMLSKSLAVQLSLPYSEKFSPDESELIMNTPAGRSELGRPARIASVQIGDAVFSNLDAAIVLDDAFFRGVHARMVGILGMSVFSDCVITIDYPGKRFILSTQTDAIASRTAAHIIPVELYRQVPVCNMRVNGRNHKAQVDTGNSLGISLSTRAVEPSELNTEKTTGLASMNGYESVHVAKLKGEVVIGDIVLENPTVYIRAINLVGGGFLCDYKLTVNQKGRYILLE